MNAILITSSILIVLIAALRPLLRGKIDPRVPYALWLLAVLRLLAPVEAAPSAFSAMNLVNRAEERTHVAQTIGQTTIPAQSYNSAREQVLEEYRRQGVEEAALTPGDLMTIDDQARARMKGPTLSELFGRYARPVWLVGAAVAAAWFLLVNLRLRRLLRDARPVEADCPLPVYVSGRLPSPCLFGTLRPAVFVTPAALESPGRLRHVLAHELTHYRHRDHWWALVRCLCLCVYWFDPLVWWAAALSRQDGELACDEGAIRRLGEEERIPYGRTLVDMIAAGRTPLLQTATTMTGGRRRVRERIRLIARRPKTVAAVAVAAALIVICAVGCTFTGAPEDPSGPPPAQTDMPEPVSGDSLYRRLTELPEGWDDVVIEPLDMVEDGSVRLALGYWLDVSEEERAAGAGNIAEVSLWSRTQFQRAYFGGSEDRAGLTCFAKTGDDFYFVIAQPTSAAFPRDSGPERYLELFDAVPEFIRETVLSTEGVTSFDPEEIAAPLRTIRSVLDEIAYAPGTSFALAHPDAAGTSPYPYNYHVDTPPDDQRGISLREYFYGVAWEELTMEQAAALMEQEGDGVSLLVGPNGADSSACVTVYKDSPLTAVRTVDNETKWYKAQCLGSDGSYVTDHLFYDYLRNWYDDVELDALRAPNAFIPNQGQSHEEIARRWAEGFEEVLAKTAPGGLYSCTYAQVRDVDAEAVPGWPDLEAMSRVVSPKGLLVEEYGETWFTFSYQVVFVPESEKSLNMLIAGNTEEYAGDDAPEGAWRYGRVGYMVLTDEGWTCLEPGCTGW